MQGKSASRPPDLPSLTPREEEVLALLAQGLSVKEMAKALGLSPDTVKDHLENLYAKLEARNRVEALEKARSLGFLQ
jgi:two-component system nitrate/nitrite response regulator NarL